jgi:hypothetical protein
VRPPAAAPRRRRRCCCSCAGGLPQTRWPDARCATRVAPHSTVRQIAPASAVRKRYVLAQQVWNKRAAADSCDGKVHSANEIVRCGAGRHPMAQLARPFRTEARLAVGTIASPWRSGAGATLAAAPCTRRERLAQVPISSRRSALTGSRPAGNPSSFSAWSARRRCVHFELALAPPATACPPPGVCVQVCVYCKMVGSHSSGEPATHKLTEIVAAYEWYTRARQRCAPPPRHQTDSASAQRREGGAGRRPPARQEEGARCRQDHGPPFVQP